MEFFWHLANVLILRR